MSLAPPRRWLWAAVACALTSPASAEDLGQADLQLRILPEANAAAVSRAAGLLCLPNGSLHLNDFMPSAEAAHAVLSAALPRGDAARQPELIVTLSGIGGKLCARDYGMFGMGKRQSFTGSVSFRFEWSARGQPRRAAVVTVDVPRREPATATAIFTQALALLAGKIAA